MQSEQTPAQHHLAVVRSFLKTEAGGSRVLDMLVGDPLPRIC